VQRVDAQPGPVTYSAVWHREGQGLAYTYARGDGAGPGEVFYALGAERTAAGCGAARTVLAWLPGGRLVTRDEDNLYVVDAAGCTTQSAVDARRMHHIQVAPGGAHMAFVHRELVYDRSEGAYVPDSSLVLSRLDGAERQELFGNERSVRHLRWSPDGTELAFDALLEGASRRQVVVYNLNRDETVYLVPPPSAPDADQVHPRWSPSGSHVAFTLRDRETAHAAVQVQGQLRRLAPTDGPVWGWVDDRSLVAPGSDSLRVVGLEGSMEWTAPRPTRLLHVGRLDPATP
jgi:Tol biopolymer transport system component